MTDSITRSSATVLRAANSSAAPSKNPSPQEEVRPVYLQILREHRLQSGVSQRELADRLGVGRSTFSNFENGYFTARPTRHSFELMRRAALSLNMPEADLQRALTSLEGQARPLMPSRPRRSPFAEFRPKWSEYLIDLRLARHLTADNAATLLGLTQQTWTGLETGTRQRNGERVTFAPKEETLNRIAVALSLTDAEVHQLRALAAEVSPSAEAQEWQQALRKARLGRSMSVGQCAALAEVSPTTYRSWEKRASGAAQHAALLRLLPHLGFTAGQRQDFMRLVPNDQASARPPTQPTRPMNHLPGWSAFLTRKRLERGLYLSDLDARVGQQSVVRRFELGGWPRKDGRLSVATVEWLDRVADALKLDDLERAELHLLADRERVALAAQGKRPLAAEILHEARKAVGLSQRQAEALLEPLPTPWGEFESGSPEAMGSLSNQVLLDRIIEILPVRPALARVLLGAVFVPSGTSTPATAPVQAPRRQWS